MGEKVKIVVLHNIFTPHIVPLFRRLHQSGGVDLKVFFTSFTSPERNWSTKVELGFPYGILPKVSISYHGKDFFSYVINPTIAYHLWKEKTEVLIAGGYDSFSSQVGFLFCKAFGRNYILWSGSTQEENSWRRRAGKPLIKTIVRKADACLAYGTRSKDFLVALGAEKEKVFISPNTVDIEYFAKASQLTEADKENLKGKIGIKTSQVILYVGQLIERKGLQYLLPAFGRLRKEDQDISLLIIGRGNQEEEFKILCQRDKISDVFFIGHKDYDEIPEYYGIADIFVLPSTEEVWGLVVNEAMACRLPIVTTRRVGASPDLLKDGLNGFLVEPGDANVLFNAMLLLIRKPQVRREMGLASYQIIRDFTIDEAIRAFESALQYVRCREKRDPHHG